MHNTSLTELIPDLQLQENTAQRTPCIVLVDGSSSMAGRSIAALNDGLRLLETELKAHDLASTRVQLQVIRFGFDAATNSNSGQVLVDWTDAHSFTAPQVEANGQTPLGAAMAMAIDSLAKQKRRYAEAAITYTRPWIFILSDGEPNDAGWEQVADQTREGESRKQFAVFPIGVEGANLQTLGRFSSNAPMRLDGLRFADFFLWLSNSLARASNTAAGQTVQVAAPTWSLPT